jgi:hypothetical protein
VPIGARKPVLPVMFVCCVLAGWLVWSVAPAFAAAPSVGEETAAPSVGEETLVKVGTGGATLSARIETGGAEASYSVQYGTGGAYGSETAPVALSPSKQTVSASLTGLQSGTEYHARFVATNEHGTVDGGGITFTTYAAGVLGLPGGRVWEMVSPAENENADVYEPGGEEEALLYTSFPAGFQAAADGDAAAYISEPVKGGNGSNGREYGEQHLSVRGSQGGWTQTSVTPPGSEPNLRYEGFSEDLSSGVFTSEDEAPLAPVTKLSWLTEEGPSTYYHIPFSTRFGDGLYSPLFDGRPPHRAGYEPEVSKIEGFREHSLLGNQLGAFGSLFGNGSGQGGVFYAGSSTNSEDLLFEANEQLLDGEGPPALEAELNGIVEKEVEGVTKEARLYREDEESKDLSFQRQSELVATVESLDNRDELYESHDGHSRLVNVLPNGKVAPGATFGGQGTETDFTHDISSDGSRVFWTLPEASIVEPGPRFQQGPGLVYVRVDGSSTVQVSRGPAQFWTASPDGDDAFYTEAGKLWRFELEGEKRVELAGAASGVVGVLGANETGLDGSYVYFVSTEALPGSNQAGLSPVSGQNNLYVYEPDAQTGGSRVAFIATLGGGEAQDWYQNMGPRLSNVTPNGHALTFVSRENLTGKPYPDEGEEDVYVYDADEGSLVCASCRAQVSGGHFSYSNSLVYTYRRISEDGDEVFFDSSAPLVARDVNGTQDVYEWEREGSGECRETSGCVYLLSGGVEGDALFMDASVSGNDVFFVSRQKLIPEDGGEDSTLYDARVDGALPVSPPECTGTGCQGPPSAPPIFATPASVTFEGVGNFAPAASLGKSTLKSKTCPKGYAKRKGKCVKKAHKHKRRDEPKRKAGVGKVFTSGGRSR